jgi:hypothetical protein
MLEILASGNDDPSATNWRWFSSDFHNIYRISERQNAQFNQKIQGSLVVSNLLTLLDCKGGDALLEKVNGLDDYIQKAVNDEFFTIRAAATSVTHSIFVSHTSTMTLPAGLPSIALAGIG